MVPAHLKYLLLWPCLAHAYLQDLPPSFHSSPATWAYISYENPSVAVLQGSFNRSVFDSPFEGDTSDPDLVTTNKFLNTTDFIAYDEKFLDLIGPNAQVKHVQHLAYQSHEAPCYNPKTKQLFFVEWGPPGGDNGTHTWQYLLDTKNNTLRKIQTSPPTANAHGCVIYNDMMYVVTDGSHNETGALVQIDPNTFKKKVLLNNYYQQPFMGFNDLDIDSHGNFWLTDSKSAYGRDLIPFYPPINPTVYMGVVYLPDTGVSEFKPVSKKNPYGNRALVAYDVSNPGGLLTNARLLNNPISYFYDGIRVSRNGWIFTGAGDGVDVIDPISGLTLGTIRVGGGENLAVSVTFGEHELWIVGRGGVWHVSGIQERLDRRW